jgi:hypothetical protein
MSKNKKTKLIIETSCIPVALNESSDSHRVHFDKAIGDGEIWSSVYVRKEFIQRWIRTYIHVAFLINHYGTLDEALGYIEEDFSPRTIKTWMHALRGMLGQQGSLINQKAAAKEVGRMAILKLKKFDRLFRRRIDNSCGCRAGGKNLVVDHNSFFESLRRFVADIDDVKNCPVNEFLNFKNDRGPANMLLKDVAAAETSAGKSLAKYAKIASEINCNRCSRIGDAVIAMEQPPSYQLVHIDGAFLYLCRASG